MPVEQVRKVSCVVSRLVEHAEEEVADGIPVETVANQLGRVQVDVLVVVKLLRRVNRRVDEMCSFDGEEELDVPESKSNLLSTPLDIDDGRHFLEFLPA